MSKRIRVSTIINKPLEVVWDEVKIMKNHVNWMQDAAKIDFLSLNESGIDTKMKVLTKVGPFSLNDIITVTKWEEMNSIGVVHEGIVTGEGTFYLSENDMFLGGCFVVKNEGILKCKLQSYYNVFNGKLPLACN